MRNRLEVNYSENLNDTNCLWMIEGENPQHGGHIKTGSKYRIKHVSSKKYLTVGNKQLNEKNQEFYSLGLGDFASGQSL